MRVSTTDPDPEEGTPGTVLLTIGHSNHPHDTFLSALTAHGVRRLVDVRRFPSSRRFPHFNAKPLALALEDAGITYRHMAPLGGRREPAPSSPHGAIKDPLLRSYADHMATTEFREALEELVEIAAARRTAIMCAEADPNRCHRRLIADALTLRGLKVLHILDETTSEAHVLPPYLRTEGGELVYDGGALMIDFGDGHVT